MWICIVDKNYWFMWYIFDKNIMEMWIFFQAKDVDQILQQLTEDPRKDGTEAVRGGSSSQSNNQQQTSPTTSAYPARCKSVDRHYPVSFSWSKSLIIMYMYRYT